MDTCPDCGRSKDTDWCGYCWGLAAGAAYHRGGIEEVERMNKKNSSGSSCLLVLLSGAAIPAAFDIIQRIT